MEEKTLDYVRLWKTLIRIGLKNRFSEVRTQFFMKIASDGLKIYNGHEDLYKIIEESYLFSLVPDLSRDVDFYIGEHDKFKHYEYSTEDGGINIEYFANTSTQIDKKLTDADNADAACFSKTFKVNKIIETIPEGVEGDEVEPIKKMIEVINTGHLIVISEASPSINPDNYPKIIKHELTHACIYEIRLNFKEHRYDGMHVPTTWTDADIDCWLNDLKYLEEVLNSEDDAAYFFKEFVCDFLMYESDGQTKEKNPMKESRVPKTNNPNGKPRITYRTLTPIDRFEEQHMPTLDPEYQSHFQNILDELHCEYDEYDKFLDDCKMG